MKLSSSEGPVRKWGYQKPCCHKVRTYMLPAYAIYRRAATEGTRSVIAQTHKSPLSWVWATKLSATERPCSPSATSTGKWCDAGWGNIAICTRRMHHMRIYVSVQCHRAWAGRCSWFETIPTSTDSQGRGEDKWLTKQPLWPLTHQPLPPHHRRLLFNTFRGR